MVALTYANIFTADIDRLADFYSGLFDLDEILESRSPIFRGFLTGGSSIGFSAPDAYDLLGLKEQELPGDRVLLTFDVESEEMVRSLTAKAARLGASILKEPFTTYYGWFQSVLRDLDGNAFRINFHG
ncbi:MAG: glyoxalase/bleomycin resistance/dioxygenase family protein [Novosphingobium sp.]|uniref:VOC family protein n=1 Tax=Novosphingobium naphthalenivorans TaxID=273168 RepID=UPI00082DDEAC|nr:VOC family protein [Novosphingobium naphthalenivorans]MAC58592.1 glyoxalase/bleomycin resistance/dioxygenase family protein [Novosphingobium sp.]|tara:strand:- start:2761 stop:3144 length:384 start_codon:yes stop_codon:yes gene_type:complete